MISVINGIIYKKYMQYIIIIIKLKIQIIISVINGIGIIYKRHI